MVFRSPENEDDYLAEFEDFVGKRRKALRALPSDAQRVMFCGSCCERMLGNYLDFFHEAKSGDPEFMAHALDDLWRSAAHSHLNDTQCKTYRQRIYNLAPSDENYSGELLRRCHNAAHFCDALSRSFDYLSGRNIEDVCGIGDVAFNAVEEFVREELGREAKIANAASQSANFALLSRLERQIRSRAWRHEWVQREVEKQLADLERLGSIQEIDDEIVADFRRSSTYAGLSSLDLDMNY